MIDIKKSIFFTVISMATICLIAYLASISHNLTDIDAFLFKFMAVMDITVMLIGGYGMGEYIYTKMTTNRLISE